jgi:predicted membrane chloride channel (bestrophin family)
VTRTLTGHGAAEIPVLNLILSLLGLVAAVAMWLAFLPPAAYQRFVEARNRRAAALPSAPA